MRHKYLIHIPYSERESVGFNLALSWGRGKFVQGAHILARCLYAFILIFGLSALADGASHPYRAGEVLVKLKGQPGSSHAFAQRQAVQAFADKVRGSHRLNLVGSWSGMNLHHMKLDPSSAKSVEETVADLAQMPEVEFAEPNYIVQKSSVSDVSADAVYSYSQVQIFSQQGYAMTHAAIQAPPAWPILAASNTHTVVAVIDTGLDLTHPAFANAIWTNPREVSANGVDDDGNGYVDDIHGWNFAYNTNNPQDDEGHGTHVSGIVLGTGQNVFQSPAPATDVEIMPLKFLDSTGRGATSDAIKAIYYAVNMGARVMNNSWGGGAYSQSLAEAIAYAYNDDVLFVAAAGNSTNNNDVSPSYPASYQIPNVVSVAATDDSDVMAYFSNYGTQSVALSAPGVNILSTYKNSQYATMSGTSMASPFVAGVAALMRYQNPSMNCWQIKQLLLQSTDKVSYLSSYVATSGRVNVLKSVQAAMNTPVDPSKPAYYLTTDPRGIASIDARGSGCGLVAVMGKDYWKNNDPTNRLKQVVVTLALLLLPVFLIQILRKPTKTGHRRKYERFELDSAVTFKIGGQELVGAVKTISLGGSDLNTEALLKEGSVISMSISGPDGKSQIQVQGHIVWSEKQKRYGVQFDSVSDKIKAQILDWQKGLKSAA